MATMMEPGKWLIQERTLVLPAEIRDASFFGAAFLCPMAGARRTLQGTGMTAVSVAGRSVSTLACIQYRDCDLGNYVEVGVQVLVRGPDRTLGLFTVELPVTEQFTLEAGRDIWGMPKWLSESEMTVSHRTATVEIREQGALVLRAELDAGPLRLPATVKASAPTWSTRTDGPDAGEVLKGVFGIAMGGVRFRLGGARITLGQHRMSEAADSLGMTGRALATFGSHRLTGSLGSPASLGWGN
ncbi:hypothetical protein E2F47_13570 [Mycobacterium eburneum]|nr:acetoacetate decarboxylase family protein [Mycobacterium eburneum]TDH52888.1 hypothetical protein E2F47_13570 [Mycobacterium eburneum]